MFLNDIVESKDRTKVGLGTFSGMLGHFRPLVHRPLNREYDEGMTELEVAGDEAGLRLKGSRPLNNGFISARWVSRYVGTDVYCLVVSVSKCGLACKSCRPGSIRHLSPQIQFSFPAFLCGNVSSLFSITLVLISRFSL
jgi:hypothetical protein